MPSTDVATTTSTAPATTGTSVAKARKPRAAAKPAAKVASYPVATLVVNQGKANAAKAMASNAKYPNQAAKQAALGYSTPGLYAMACYNAGVLPNGQPLGTNGQPLVHAHYGTKGGPNTPQALAALVAKGRAQGHSWGKLAAAYRVTEGTVRLAYQAATKAHHSTSGVGAWAGRRG